ncbi:thioredoxin family protein [Pullulanibacillus sp. KACC 23026]|uniref:thioredoxin family protein n=1 Tax=Pullulanibacillus sp. KACC 23026 TaxID=3028315 RepID=UPI0023AEDEFA|nr:thioredoxin family protein [Pullulanibacillus sp. KACC 23026]WEG13758.1 thioredoxin family protein [Pullulanibacillus sp. KACC 23026]
MRELSMESFLADERKVYEVLFFHTPFCGTCQLGERMLKVVEEALKQPSLAFYSCRVSEWQSLVQKWQISSVPALVLLKNGERVDSCYAFESVPFLYDFLQKFITNSK